MSAWAKPGVKCVCVDAVMQGPSPLERGAVYELASIIPAQPAFIGRYRAPAANVRLKGVSNPYNSTGTFAVERFRPLITRTQEQDVAAFHHHLAGAPVLEPQDA